MSKVHRYSNKEVVVMLKEVLAAMEVKNINRFRIRAYQNAISSIDNLTTSIHDLWELKRLEEIPGVGAGLEQHLGELFSTGKVTEWEELKKDLPSGMFELIALRGVGAKTAFKLSTEFNLQNRETAFAKVKEHAEKHEIQVLSGFGEKSEKDILEAIENIKKSKNEKKRTLLVRAEQVADRVIGYMKECEAVIDIQALGSLRRRAPTVGDIDLTVSTNSNEEVLDHFSKYREIKDILTQGDKMMSVLLTNDLQLDILCTKPEAFGSMLQHFTGSKQHNVLLRTYALEHKMSLSQHGIKENDDLKEFASEKEFYNYLGLDWIPPEIREGTKEIELAKDHKSPELITQDLIKGEIHTHTVASDGVNTLKEMVESAKNLEYEYIGISDHAPSVQSRGSYEVLGIIENTRSNIEQINNSQNDIRVLYGYEANILADKTMSLPDNIMQKLDYVIGSVHTSFDQDEITMTERFLNAIRNPYVNVIGHPTNRLINERDPVDANWDKILDELKKHDKVIEINSQPSRLDLTDDLVKEAVKRKIKIIINTDSHSIQDLALLKYGIDVARRGWCEPSNVINTLPYKEFVKALNARV